MKIYTKNGDKGLTSLYNSAKISKSSVLIDLIGDLDELNCYIGNITSSRLLEDLQIWIFDLCTIIANPTHKYTFDKNEVVIKLLEKEIDDITNELPKLNNFILPTGNIHIARAVTRRCERKLVNIVESTVYSHIPPNCLIFLNRLSDYLFTLARFENLDKREVIYRKSNIIANVVDNDE
jgi:cob(I)alamin adenosyltransferase